MPRTSRTSSTAVETRLAGKKDGLNATKKNNVKQANNIIKATEGKRRAALGEITNAFSGTTSQAKKGLTKMLNKSKSSLVRQVSLRKKDQVVKESRKKQPLSTNDEEMETEFQLSDETNSLPSSQQDYFKDCKDNKEHRSQQNGGDEEKNRKQISSPAKPPPGVDDFDAENEDDPNQVSEYVKEIFKYYKDREEKFKCPDYINTVQTEITPAMRGILVDWLVEVQESFELNHETLYTAVKILDIFLSRVNVKKEQLQLVGATACLIASKVDERLPPLLDDFVYVCDDAYRKDDIRRMEIKMFTAVGFDLGFPLSYRFLRRYGRVCKVTMPVLTFARFVIEMALMEYSLNVEISESLLAASALVFTFKIMEIEGWEKTLEYYSGYNLEECKPIVYRLHKMLLKPPHETRRTIRTKYEHQVFHQVALTPIPNELIW